MATVFEPYMKRQKPKVVEVEAIYGVLGYVFTLYSRKSNHDAKTVTH